MDRLGAGAALAAAGPHPITRFALHFRRSSKHARLPAPAMGLSRYCLDELLLGLAAGMGARVSHEPAPAQVDPPVVIATGRHFQGKRGGRLFGFKAHFTGPPTDSVELFFFDGCYVGVNGVEGGVTNVCGIAPEELLGRHGFEPDSLLAGFPRLRERTAALARSMDWLVTGPLYFRHRLDETPLPGHFHAGDQLSFVDPFTGTGMLAALLSGTSAGHAAAVGESSAAYLRETARKLRSALRVSAVFRWSIETGFAERVVQWIPASLLVGWTRPRTIP